MTPPRQTGVVLRIAGGTYHVKTNGRRLECVLAGRLKREGSERIAVGDRVEVEEVDDEEGRIVEILPRKSKLARQGVARSREQVIAANVDCVAAVFSVARPEPDLRMLDRMLVLAELNGLDALVVVNKTDLLSEAEDLRSEGGSGDSPGADWEIPDDEREIPAPYRPHARAGYPVITTSVPEERGLSRLAGALRDRVTVMAGPSGTGKSSLLNAMVPGLERRVREVGDRSGRGRHTTVNATMIPLPEGGYVVDTPGLQYLELPPLPPAELSAGFPEFRPHLDACRFNDCRHVAEPGCAVREALEAGAISSSRYESYRSLLEAAEEKRRQW